MTRIFLSYRRSDSADFTARLYERLAGVFGRKNLFKDIDSIPGGRDFRAAIEVSVLQSDIMLVIIGSAWLTIGDQTGRRLDNPEDPVRGEIEMAMRHNKRILPILVDSTPMPLERDLPPRLQNLAYIQAHRIRIDANFDRDVQALLRQIGGTRSRGAVAQAVALGIVGVALVAVVLMGVLRSQQGGSISSTETPSAATQSPETPITTGTDTTLATPISCPNALSTRLVNGMHGRIIPGEANNRLRAAPRLDAPIVSMLSGGTEFDVIGDPICGDGFTWVPISILGLIGYTAEGDANGYWIEPYTASPSDSTPEATGDATG